MKKTAAQLDKEIAAALAGEHYYVVIDRPGDHRTIYGPFETQKEAEYAAYFAKPVADRDSMPASVYFPRDVARYDAEEIRSLVRYPEEYELKSVKLRPGPPPMHASWKKFDADSRAYLRDSDYDTYQLILRNR